MPITVSALYVYPIKSCAGTALETADLDARGIRRDRQWMIVEDGAERGHFLTQREHPALARVLPRIEDDALTVTAPGLETLRLPLDQQPGAPTLPVVVWRDTCIAVDEGDAAAEWISTHLGAPARIVRMDDAFVRPLDLTYAKEPGQTGFSDGYPLLFISEESLADLNARLAERGKAVLPMSRFRPNVVVRGAQPYAEDGWTRFTINDIPLDAVKTCARCAITTVDPSTGTIPDREEPLATLATYRKAARGVMFGQNVVHRATGALRVGDALMLS